MDVLPSAVTVPARAKSGSPAPMVPGRSRQRGSSWPVRRRSPLVTRWSRTGLYRASWRKRRYLHHALRQGWPAPLRSPETTDALARNRCQPDLVLRRPFDLLFVQSHRQLRSVEGRSQRRRAAENHMERRLRRARIRRCEVAVLLEGGSRGRVLAHWAPGTARADRRKLVALHTPFKAAATWALWAA